jgi:hypothetical protein
VFEMMANHKAAVGYWIVGVTLLLHMMSQKKIKTSPV